MELHINFQSMKHLLLSHVRSRSDSPLSNSVQASLKFDSELSFFNAESTNHSLVCIRNSILCARSRFSHQLARSSAGVRPGVPSRALGCECDLPATPRPSALHIGQRRRTRSSSCPISTPRPNTGGGQLRCRRGRRAWRCLSFSSE